MSRRDMLKCWKTDLLLVILVRSEKYQDCKMTGRYSFYRTAKIRNLNIEFKGQHFAGLFYFGRFTIVLPGKAKSDGTRRFVYDRMK